MTRTFVFSAVLFAVSALAEKPLPACDTVAKQSKCSERREGSPLTAEDYAKMCKAFGGKSVAACPKDKQLGWCLKKGDKERDYYYSDGAKAFTAEKAEKKCTGEFEGTFNPAK
ncbi:MAG: hypothetical protein QM723_21235 [Myxococcaceae bacterium]